jgi:hypothetical protein
MCPLRYIWTFSPLIISFPEVDILLGGASNNVAKADAEIWHIIEIYQIAKTGLDWKLRSTAFNDLVAHSINLCQ